VCVYRSRSIREGYWNRPEATAEAMRGGWLHTGDAGHLDEAGYFYVDDRLKDTIITGGSNVYSAEVENALTGHPAVTACAVIAVPDTELGERVHAVVVPAPGTDVDLDALREYARASLAEVKLPGSLAIVDALPLSATGKPLKRALREPHWARRDRQVN
jgi:acyl-CoA synthetase (AMP-forming)/AMP-acid ligase II